MSRPSCPPTQATTTVGLRVVRILLWTAVLAGVTLFGGAPVHAERVHDAQWHLDTLRMERAWPYADGRDVIVAVLDSGVDASHPDLKGQVLPGADFVDGRGDGRSDRVGHGTTVAGLIAGRRDRSGVTGIAHRAKILPVRVLDRENRYEDASVVARGVRYAVDRGATVVNISLGGSLASTELADAIRYAHDHDVVVVACGGNVSGRAGTKPTGGVGDTADDGDGTLGRIWYPARESGVVAVTGLNRDGSFWKGSLTGESSAISAPATRIVGARPGGYWRVRGTSFAAPMVSATAALIRSRWPEMTAPNVVNRLIRTARDLGAPGRDDRYGYGMLNPVAALSAPVRPVTDNPLDAAPQDSPSATPLAVPPAAQVADRPGRTPYWVWLGTGVLLVVVMTLFGIALARGSATNRDEPGTGGHNAASGDG